MWNHYPGQGNQGNHPCPAPHDPNMMDVDLIQCVTTDTKKERYKKEGHCFTCRKQGHLSCECPQKVVKARTMTMLSVARFHSIAYLCVCTTLQVVLPYLDSLVRLVYPAEDGKMTLSLISSSAGE